MWERNQRDTSTEGWNGDVRQTGLLNSKDCKAKVYDLWATYQRKKSNVRSPNAPAMRDFYHLDIYIYLCSHTTTRE